MLHSRKLHQINYAKYVRSRKSPAIFGYNNHNRDENAFSFPFFSFSLSFIHFFSLFPSHTCIHTTHTYKHSFSVASTREGETFHLAVIGMELSKVLNLSISVVYTCMCIYDCSYVRVYCLRVSCVCCMLLSVYDTFTIITIRCSSSTIRLNSQMYTFNIYIYIIRKKVYNRAVDHSNTRAHLHRASFSFLFQVFSLLPSCDHQIVYHKVFKMHSLD